VGGEGADESRLLPPREFAANGGLLAFHIDAQPRVGEAAPQGVTAPGYDDEVAVDSELDSVRDLDGSSNNPATGTLSPQYTYAMSLPPTPICFAFVCEITPSVVVRIRTPKSWAGR